MSGRGVSPALAGELRENLPGLTILEKEPLWRHCSFRIGGECDMMVSPSTTEEIEGVCRLLREKGEEPLLMGNGTNLLITDAPVHRVVLRLGEVFSI